PPVIANSGVFHVGNSAFVMADVSNASEVELMVTTSPYNSKFQSFEMLDDGTNGDQTAGDGIYSAPLPFQASQADIKYYIRAQNPQAIMLDPERAEYEFYIYERPLDIDDNQDAAFKVYPNPAKSFITVESEGFLPLDYELISVLGERVLFGKTRPMKHQINIERLVPGVYFLKVGNRTIKIVKAN
ncbi:MAG: hypothetical protein ACJATS_002148, partial [Psychroserpens sp.]